MAPRKKPSSKSNQNQPNSQPSKFGIQHFFLRHSESSTSRPNDAVCTPGPNPPSQSAPPLQNPTAACPENVLISATAARNNAVSAPKPPPLEFGLALQNPKTAPSLGIADENDAVSASGNPRKALNLDSTDPKNGLSTSQNPSNAGRIESVSNFGNALNSGTVDSNNAVSAWKNPRNAFPSASTSNSRKTDPNNPSQSTPPGNIPAMAMDVEENPSQVSPEVSKSMALKRFKFSPGMLIKQSQDDGGDEVTWKISPVNERLQAMTKKHGPEVMRVLGDASRLISLNFRQCSQNKTSPDSEGKLEKWLCSPTMKASEKSVVFSNRVSLKRVKLGQVMDSNGNEIDMTDPGVVRKRQSPFRTPPSLSYCHEKNIDGVDCKLVSDQMGLRQHKKALLELLDQVEDAISVEESVSSDGEACLSKVQCINGDEMPLRVDPALTIPEMGPTEKVNGECSNIIFLVLEVSEKREYADLSGAQCPSKVLRLLNEKTGEEQAVYLRDEWFYTVIAPGDTIHVIGKFDDQGKCDVDHYNNFVIVHPDILVSGTRVAASFSCSRRTVLDERLKCSEHSTAALIGTLLHQIFQAGLIREIPTKVFLEEYARIVVQKNLESLYACGVNEDDMYKTLIEATPRILNWIVLFKNSQEYRGATVDFGSDDGLKRVNVSEVIDIEEMAWAPKYGLKGMIDASLRVKFESNTKEVNEIIMPLEFKTGKGTKGQSAMEHTAQVILYTLLMSERYLKPIDSGLLYYLNTDHTQGIAVKRSDLVGLIMRRNELAKDILKASMMQQLPPMLQAHGGSMESSGLGDLFDSNINHLTTSHFAFLRHWDWLIDLEAKEMEVMKKGIWRSHSLKRDPSTSCLSSIVLDTSNNHPQKNSFKDNKFIYRFVRQNVASFHVKEHNEDSLPSISSPANDLDCTLRNGDYVILSTESGHLALASGVITDISRFHVYVCFSKRLRLPWSKRSLEEQDLLGEVFRIDKDEIVTSFAVMRFNLIQLFLQSMQGSHLRKMIVDLEVPRFDGGCIFSQDPAISYIRSEKSLNNDQRQAILKILTAKDYALILGMPGTGKTSTMVHAVKALLMRGASILLTSYTNSAVDNLLIKLKAQNIDFVRIGRHEVVHEEIQGHCFSGMDINSVEDIKLRLDQVSVVAVTCLGITNPLLANKRFDICIMDEAGQTTLPVSLGPLMFASIFVLVGDHYQLPPLVQSAEARENGMGISLFCRLSEAHPQAISALQSQYRMCQGIMALSNALIYGNRLRCGSSQIANARLKFSSSNSISSWLKKALDPERPVIFINTDMLSAFEAKDHKTVNNPIEACIISEVAEELVNNGIEGEDIGIITPYNSQANLIRHTVSTTSVEINTIDKYQGRDKDCILVSFVRSSENPRNCTSSLLGDWHRINVALTRAKRKLIMVGSFRTLSKVPLLRLLIEKVEEQSGRLNVSSKDINYKGELKRCSQLR
ncbi:hypothetical protein PVL29_019664 [Vitis rotundifolia]|uniref:DNA replication ATP-dependent helicase/nuclease n=1 Tax=Vitis rotundifolia TaxID=103349 RepID=A0AA38Z116_VITRO|nr:hypothetical protein PVL29_019664 [Vitis rotundifolia]